MKTWLFPALLLFNGCDLVERFNFPLDRVNTDPEPILYQNVTTTNLPFQDLGGPSMDVEFADVDKDGDLDIIIACEFCRNILLINDGNGKFTNESDWRLPFSTHDSEDIGLGDFDCNGWVDIIIVSEDDQIHELYLNRGNGFFDDASNRIPVTGESNTVVVNDFNKDGFPDILLSNGSNLVMLINDRTAHFINETSSRLPNLFGTTQDMELGDVDNDRDLDLLVANEGIDWLLVNDGMGHFTDESNARLKYTETQERTREGDFGDVNNDGFLDILFANEFFSGAANESRRDRLLLNDKTGRFTEAPESQFPLDKDDAFDGDFLDIDRDGDLDIITANCDIFGNSIAVPYGIYLNDGNGSFTRVQSGVLPPDTIGCGFDIEFADLNKDGIKDLYIANRNTTDLLLFGIR